MPPLGGVTAETDRAHDVHAGSEPLRPSERTLDPSARMIISSWRRAKTMHRP
jgi:hypothetical protein